MKIVTICHCGVTRSVGIAWYLRQQGHDTIPIPFWPHLMTEATRRMICTWAERIILAQPLLLSCVPEEFRAKVTVWDVGPDTENTYNSNPVHPELQRRIAECADREQT